MKKQHTFLIAAVVILMVVASLGVYTIQESEQVVIVRLGEIIGEPITEPGLKFKWPFIDDAKRFEKRWLEWDGEPNQITTSDKRYIFIDVFARWRIENAKTFIEVLRDERTAQGRLDDIIDSVTRNVIANHNLIEAIRTTNRAFFESDEEKLLTMDQDLHIKSATPDALPDDEPLPEGTAAEPNTDEPVKTEEDAEPVKAPVEASASAAAVEADPANHSAKNALYTIEVGREKLTRLILEKASIKAAQLGIELKDVQIKRINYIDTVQDKVFERMISERKRVAEAFRSQGRGKSAEILGRTEKELKKIQSEAYRKSEEIKGNADAEAAAIYAQAYKRDPELYNFLKTLESYEKTIDTNSWLILSTDADYARHLRTMKKSVR